MKKILHTFLLILSCTALPAQTLPSLLVDADAASAGRAGITPAFAPSAWSAEYMTAAMPFLGKEVSAAASYGSWQPAMAGDKVLGASVAASVTDRLAVGLAARNFAMPQYTVINESGAESQVNGTFSPKEASVALGAAFAASEYLSFGLLARMTSSVLARDAKANVFGADVSLAYRKDAFSAGAVLSNMGGKVSYGGDGYAQPSLAKAGASYRFGDPEASSVTAGAEAGLLFSGGVMAGAGAEYAFRQMVSVRAGYHYGDAAKAVPSYASVGAGIHFDGFTLDAAFLLASETLGGSMFFTLGYAF